MIDDDLHHVSVESVLHRLGGPAAVEATIDRFYDKVVRDTFLAPFFARTNLADLKVHQTHFILLAFTNLLPSEDDYQQVCAYLIKHHQRLFRIGLNETHFDRVAGHLVVSLHELHVKPTLVDEVAATLLPLRPAFHEGARQFGSGESKEKISSDSAKDGDVEDVNDPRKAIEVLTEFNRRISSDPKLCALRQIRQNRL
jgi:hemoglobin